VVILTDGTKIVGTIIAVGQRRLLIIEKDADGERAIERANVESFRRGAGEGRTVSYEVVKDTEKGVLVLSEAGEIDPTTTPSTGPAPAPTPKPKPAPKPKPKPKPKPSGAGLDKLWDLLEGNPSPEKIGSGFAGNPKWKSEIGKLIRQDKLPPRGRRAFVKLRARLRKDPAFRNGLAQQVLKGKLPISVLEILKAK
jgi:hypothetical protein